MFIYKTSRICVLHTRVYLHVIQRVYSPHVYCLNKDELESIGTLMRVSNTGAQILNR